MVQSSEITFGSIRYWMIDEQHCRGEMAPAERKNYTDAVLCLARKPPRLSTALFPGVRSRFDDFVAYVDSVASSDRLG